jgi:hypothetical protein
MAWQRLTVSCPVRRRVWQYRPAVLVVTAGLTVAGCASNTSNTPATASTTPSPPMMSSTLAQPQPTIHSWAKSMCQALGLAFLQLGTPPQPDLANLAATRQAFGTYLSNAANATQQAIDLLSLVGAPPVDNGQRILDQMRTQLTQLRSNLDEMATQLKASDANDAAAFGQALAAAGNAVGLLGTLASQPQLRDAIEQTTECQALLGRNAPTTGPTSRPPS